MDRSLLRKLLVVCILSVSTLVGAENGLIDNTPTLPDPTDLSSNWWDYFDSQDAKIQEPNADFIATLRDNSKNLSPENRQQADLLISKIEAALQGFRQIRSRQKPEAPPPPPVGESYTISQLLKLHRNLQRREIELKTVRTQETDESRQISIAEQYLTSLRTNYNETEDRSERKFLIGLEIILYTISYEVDRLTLDYLAQERRVKQISLDHTREEIGIATERLRSTPAEQLGYQTALRQAEADWEQARQALQQAETESVVVVTGSLSRAEEIQNQKLLSNLRTATLLEAVARTRLILTRLEYQLSLLLNNPESVDISKLDAIIEGWDDELMSIQSKIDTWNARIEELLQQYSRVLSLSDEEAEKIKPAVQEIVAINQENRLITQELRAVVQDSLFLLKTVDQKLIELVSPQQRLFFRISDAANYLFGNLSELMNKSLIRLGPDRSITIGGLVRFVLIILVTLWIARFTRRGLRRISQSRRGIQKSVAYSVSRLISYSIITLGIVIALTALGFDFSNLIIIAGALGVGLGFGLQSIFNNFISGLIILFEGQVQVGDFIELEDGGLRGEIREIRVRSTLITTNDGTDVLIPNAEIISNRLINWTLREPYRRMHVPFSVSYGTDKEKVKTVVLEATKKVPNTLLRPGVPEPRVHMTAFGDSALEFELVVWVDEPSSRRQRNTLSAYLWAIETALRENGITIPFPQRDVHIIAQKETSSEK